MFHLKWIASVLASLIFAAAKSTEPIQFDDPSWSKASIWDDGKAEFSTYVGTTRRYGQSRLTTARIILVKEDVIRATLVKSDAGPVPGKTVEALKHVFVADFPTGTYSYHQTAILSFARGSLELLKEVMTHSEQCGITFARIANEGGGLVHEAHSYWEGEADRRVTIAWPTPDRPRLHWDALPVWLRSLPRGHGGRPIQVWLLPSQVSGHSPLANTQPVAATIRMDVSGPKTVRVRFGNVPAHRYIIESPAGRDTFWIAAAAPHPLVRMATAAGRRLELVKTQRLDYWNHHAVGDERLLE